MNYLWILFALLVPLALFSNPVTGQESKDELAQLVKAKWEERYGKIKSVEFTFDLESVVQRGYYNWVRPPVPMGPNTPDPNKDLPATDMTFGSTQSIWISGNKIRNEASGTDFSTIPGQEKFSRITVYDGTNTRFLNLLDLHGQIEPTRKDYLSHFGLFPLSCWLGKHLESSFDLSRYLGADSVVKNDGELIEVTCNRPPIKMWLDPSFDYLPVKVKNSVDPKAVALEVVYDFDEAGNIYPSRWSITGAPAGTSKSDQYELQSIKINKPIAPEMFEWNFPPGSIYRDL